MTGHFRHILFLISLALLLFTCSAAAQTIELNPKEQMLLQAAEDSLEIENYQYSRQVFSQLLSLHNDELYFRLKYAECLVYLNSDLTQAIDYLKMVIQSGKMPEAYYYLGLANHYRYMFDKALKNYNLFLQSELSSKEKEELPVYRQIAMAENGGKLVEYAYLLNVIDNKRLTINDFFYSYKLDNMGGRFVRKHPDFQNHYDRKQEKNPIMFISNDNDYILFSSYGRRGKTGKDLYEVKRQSDNSWGDAVILDKIINTTEDEDFAYLHPDKEQLFFCSKGHNSMGGYDIFRSQWNEDTQNWGIPKNMDFPINSPMDDMLYVNDSANNFAIFASRRDSENERVNIYKILINKDPEKRKIENMQDLIKTSKLEINLLAEELETRDDNTASDQFEVETKPNDTTALIIANDEHNNEPVSLELKTYKNQKTQFEKNLQDLNEIQNALSDEQNQYKQLIAEAWTSGDTLLAVASLDVINIIDNEQSKLIADIDAFESMVQELNLKNDKLPDKPTQTKLNALTDNLERIVDNYNNFDLINTLAILSETHKEKLNALNTEIEAIKQSLNETQKQGGIDKISEDVIASHEQLRKTQNQKIAELSKLEYDYKSLKTKQEELKSSLNVIKANEESLKPTNKSVEIPLSEIQIAEQKFTNARLNSLNEIQHEIERTNRNKYNIKPWFEQSDYQSTIEKTLIQAEENAENDFPKTLIAENPDLETAIAERNEIAEEIKLLKEQLKTADELQKPSLWKAMNEQITRFEENNEIIETFISENELIAENITESELENDNQTTETYSEVKIKYPDVLPSEADRERFIKETQKSLSPVAEKQNETKTAIKNFNDTKASQLSTVNATHPQEEIIALRKSQKELIQEAIDLNTDFLDEEQILNKVLTNELYRFTEGSPGFNAELNGQIEEAIRLADESESFEISAQNTENPIRKMYFLDKGNDKIREANQLLKQLSEDIAGVEVIDESSTQRPNTKTIKSIIQKTNDQLTDIETSEPFISSVNQNQASLIIKKDEQARKYAFQLTDSLFGTREIVQTKIKENPSSNEVTDLRRQEDAIRFEIAEEVNRIYNEAQPVLENRITQNQKTIEYLNDIGLIDKRQISKLIDNPILEDQSNASNTTPIQVHRNITRLSNHMNAQIDLLHSQEALINTVRTTPTKPIPGAWYDLVNKMNRLAEPKIPVDKNFTDIQLDTYEATGIALPPNERKTKEKLEKKIAKYEGKINEIQETITEIRNAETVDDRSLKKLEKLEEKQTKESVKQTEYKVERQGWYFNLKEKTTSENPLVETVYSIADSLNQVASNQLEIIEENDPKPKVKLKQLQYAHGLLIEANQLKQSVEMYERNVIADNALVAYVKTYRPENKDIYDDAELIAENIEDNDIVDNTDDDTEQDFDVTNDIANGEDDENMQNNTNELVDTETDNNQITETTDTETDLNNDTEINDDTEQDFDVTNDIANGEDDKNMQNNTDEFVDIETDNNQITEATDTETDLNNDTEVNNDTEQDFDVTNDIANGEDDENMQNNTDELIDTETDNNQITETTDTETDLNNDTEINDDTEQNFDVTNNIANSEDDENMQNNTDEFVDTETDNNQITEATDTETDLNETSENKNEGQNTNIEDIETDENQIDSQNLVQTNNANDRTHENLNINQQNINQDDEQKMQTGDNTTISTDDDLYYRIQIVAYSRPLNDTAFRGISPVVDEQVPGRNIYRYLAGKFYNSNSWRNTLPLVKNEGFTDAFPVAYLNRERISIARARDLRYLEKDLPAEFRILRATQDDFIAQQDETDTQVDVAPANQATHVPVLEDNQSTFYSIQLGAFGSAINQDNIRGVSADFYHRKGNGYFKYFHGKFRNYEQALQQKGIVNRSIADAFIVAFNGGERVPRTEADAILQNTPPTEITQMKADENSSNKIRFRIQIGAFSNPLPPEQLQNYREAFAPYPIKSTNRDNITIYFIDGFKSYGTAGQALKIMVRPIIGDAFVTAWRDDTKITIREALQAN
ncbi:MAG: hypothetical protein U9N51_08750 [Bacteroidota bacterium]|nr:hypothetical protein [Bacteroidota bacterium]